MCCHMQSSISLDSKSPLFYLQEGLHKALFGTDRPTTIAYIVELKQHAYKWRLTYVEMICKM